MLTTFRDLKLQIDLIVFVLTLVFMSTGSRVHGMFWESLDKSLISTVLVMTMQTVFHL